MSATRERQPDPIGNPRPGRRVLVIGSALVAVTLVLAAIELAWHGDVWLVALRTGVLFVGAGAAAWLLVRENARLRESESRFALAVAGAKDGIWEWNLTNDMAYFSPRAQELFGRPSDGVDIKHKTAWEQWHHYHPDDVPLRDAAIRSHLEGRAPFYEGEWRVRHPDGSYHWILGRGVCTRDAMGRAVLFAGSTADIDARKRAEEALKRSEARYALAMQASGSGYWDWIIASDEYYASPRLLEIHGLPADSKFPNRADFVARIPLHPEDRAESDRALAAHFAGDDERFEYLVRTIPHGEVRWCHVIGLLTRDASGAPVRWSGSTTDVTERKRAEEALQLSEERHARAMEGSDAGHWDWNIVTDEMFASSRAKQMLGLAADTRFPGRTAFMASVPMHPDDRQNMERVVQASLSDASKFHERDYRVMLPGGEERWLHSRAKVFRDAGGGALRMTGSLTDITERKRAEAALRESEERFALAVAGSSDGIFDWDILGGGMFLSERAQRIYGLEPGVTVRPRIEWREMVRIHPDDVQEQRRLVEDYLAGNRPAYEGEWRVLHADGSYRWIRIRGQCVRDASGRPTRMTGSVSDIDTRRRAEDALRRSEAYLAEALRLGRAGSFAFDVQRGEYVHLSPELYSIFQVDPGAGPPSAAVLRSRVHPEDAPRWKEARERAILQKRDYDIEYRVARPDGSMRHVQVVGHPALDAAGNVVELVGTAMDITGRKAAEAALRESEERYALVVSGSSDGIFDWDLATDRVYMSARAQELFGLKPGELWRARAEWMALNRPIAPDGRGAAQRALYAYLRGEAPTFLTEGEYECSDGRRRWIRLRGTGLRDASGRVNRIAGSLEDITDRKAAEEELRRLEQQLRQSQRLEAMGTLAGGIAHDFNNILGAILGYGEMALRDAPEGSRLRRDLDSITIAGERGRALVERILAFSRSGVGERIAVNVERVVRESLDLLAANLPENVTVRPELHAGRAAMRGDPTQVHQVLMNLATNGVQAMAAGGTLRVALRILRLDAPRVVTTGSLLSGEYVVLEVADSGTGIAPETLERIFDPFFTTKEVGVGTGLGLSLVHGIVTEVGGAVDVASTAGAGSLFTVYLPRAGDAADDREGEVPEVPRGDRQRVLIVDDEEALVRLAARTLGELGYAPSSFTSSLAALEAFRADPGAFDAMITDERMPGLSGSALIRAVRGIRRDIPILLASGYLGEAAVGQARAAGADEVLKKPLSARDLATSLARVLQAR